MEKINEQMTSKNISCNDLKWVPYIMIHVHTRMCSMNSLQKFI